jgi:hypothetical protein
MSISDATETAILALIFNAAAWANYADNAASVPQTQISVALHTADPTDAGNQIFSEVAYTSYARMNVNRTTAGWLVAGSVVSPVANIDFPIGTGGAGTVTFFSCGKTGGGATPYLWSGTVTPNIVCGNGVTPRISTATTITLD